MLCRVSPVQQRRLGAPETWVPWKPGFPQWGPADLLTAQMEKTLQSPCLGFRTTSESPVRLSVEAHDVVLVPVATGQNLQLDAEAKGTSSFLLQLYTALMHKGSIT